MNVQEPIVCLITDRSLAGPRGLEADVAAAVAGGVNLVQLREKDLPTRELLALARRLQQMVSPARLVVNGRADVARAAGAAGVHLPADGLPTAGARLLLGDAALVGRSVHSVEDARRSAAEPIDYLELGTIFPSRSHPGGSTVGLAAVRAAAAYGVPVLAVGGITPANAESLIAAGAAGVAVISAILGQVDPAAAAAALSAAVAAAWARRESAPIAVGGGPSSGGGACS